MSATRLSADELGLPQFEVANIQPGDAFGLSSHERAREALRFGLDAPGTDHNVYVLGPDRAGRMSATRAFAKRWLAAQPAADDWVYLFDFDAPSKPRPVRLKAGLGRELRDAVAEVVPALARELAAAFSSESYQRQFEQLRSHGETALENRFRELDAKARKEGLTIVQTAQGALLAALDRENNPVPIQTLPAERQASLEEKSRSLRDELVSISRDAARLQRAFFQSIKSLNKQVATQATQGLIDSLLEQFESVEPLRVWLNRFKLDLIEHHEMFIATDGGTLVPRPDVALARYGVNLLVDRHTEDSDPLVTEHNPTYESLFGYIEYRQLPGGGLETDVSLIRPGALHRANGGVLLLRAEALAMQPELWGFLKAALRDGEIHIEEPYRQNAPPIAGAPKPGPVPLSVNLVLVGAPVWYYGFFALDPEFQLYFKVKAEIEPWAKADQDNIERYAGLIQAQAESLGVSVDKRAMTKLLGLSARWAGSRDRLTSSYELVADVLIEASRMAPEAAVISLEQVDAAVVARRRRNSQIEDRVHQSIEDGITLIQTDGAVVGQINGLTVQFAGDHVFGTPARITARAAVGRRGVINIERMVAMSGPIQQKASMVLQGILMQRFAHEFPLSFDCSVTFEQLYGGVEGDSASMAEYIAIISELAQLPVRQNLAITGSINQLGEAQVIGGVHHKVEGYFRACQASAAGLTGQQGVIIPARNQQHLVVRDELVAAVAAGQFHIYAVNHVEEALSLLLDRECGTIDVDGQYPPDSIYGRVMATLRFFDQALRDRGI